MKLNISCRAQLLLAKLFLVSLALQPNASFAEASPPSRGLNFFQFVVNVEVETAPIFGGRGTRGNGTGWVFRIFEKNGKKYAYIITNDHVVAIDKWVAQKITIEVKDGLFPQPDRASADVVYLSPYRDIAVLQIDLANLERSAGFLVEAPLPPRSSPLFNFEQNVDFLVGRESVAIGNPLGGRGMLTFGEISGSRLEPSYGFLIQTQAPINGGNSGGPLVDKEFGVVIGMNSLKLASADNVGMAIPIADVIADFERWEANPTVAYRKEFPAKITVETRRGMQFTGVEKIILARYPDYFRHVNSAIAVEDAIPMENGFEAGDIIVTVNGQIIGERHYRLHPILAEADVVDFEIVRNGEMIKLRQSYRNEAWQQLQRRANFVMLSGIIFQDSSPFETFLSFRDNVHQVRVTGIFPNPEMKYSGLDSPPPFSVLVGVTLNDTFHSIRKLEELKKLIRERGDATFVRLHVRNAIMGPQGMILSTVTQTPLVEGTTTTFNVPITEVLTPGNIGLNAFTRRFRFGGTTERDLRSRNWRANIREIPTDQCGRLMTGDHTPLPPPPTI